MRKWFSPRSPEDYLTLAKGLLIIFVSTLVVLSTALGVLLYVNAYREKRATNNTYIIRKIVQTGPEKESLKVTYLEELMGLSLNNPVNLYGVNLTLLEQKLMESPIIQKASVIRKSPDTLYIDYTIRRPLAYIYDLSNTVVDRDCILFPLYPFFPPKKLPEIYLGISFQKERGILSVWGKKMKDSRLDLALEMLELLGPTNAFQITRIDVSKAYVKSYGQREIVLTIQDGTQQRFLRLNRQDYVTGIERYVALKPDLIGKEATVIDLRIPHLAFLQEPATLDLEMTTKIPASRDRRS